MKKFIFSAMLMALTPALSAQTITFDTDDYKAVGVYDTWEESPFRTGALEGHAAVISNFLNDVDDVLGYAPDSTEKIVAVQRSRYGSNTFGVRIDLNETFELTTTTQYVHVLIHKPVESRVMLIGLGKRTERAGQSPETEQFWQLSSNTVTPNEWCDAVFPIKGNGGIDIYSLVVVPDLESRHDMAEDFIAYIDQIVVNDSPATATQRDDYPTNFDKASTVYTRTDRGLTAVKLQAQSLTVASSITTSLPVYQDFTSQKTFNVKPGQTVTPAFTYKGTWMNGYVYVDYDQDGHFSYDINSDGTPADGSEIVAYSNYNSLNSAGASLSSRNVLNPPTFKVPADQPFGFYCIRYKVDWNCLDPGGNTSSDNYIVSNGGAIVDVRLNIHDDSVNVNDANRNGEVLAADGSKLNGYRTKWNKAFVIKMNPERGFTYSGVRVRHGYNLAGDSLIHGIAQYEDTIFSADLFEGDSLTIPAVVVDGDIEIEGLFIEATGIEDVALNDDEKSSTVNCQLSTVFDLQGRRRQKPEKGINIVDGKKNLIP